MTFTRYAIYYAPPAEADWAIWASHWLGWDMETGRTLGAPEDCRDTAHARGLDLAQITQTPRKYGLHATLKPPMRLREGEDLAALEAACARLAATQAPVTLAGIELARLGRFLALRPLGDVAALNALAAACVRDLDHFRAAASPEELARRRQARLSAEQDAHLERWGYPYVMDQFRFHITLSGRLDDETLAATQTLLEETLVPLLPQPFEIRDLALVAEREDGHFELLHRYALAA